MKLEHEIRDDISKNIGIDR